MLSLPVICSSTKCKRGRSGNTYEPLRTAHRKRLSMSDYFYSLEMVITGQSENEYFRFAAVYVRWIAEENNT
jgi:hypothetical protein